MRKNIEKKNREKIYYIIINDKTREKEREYKKNSKFLDHEDDLKKRRFLRPFTTSSHLISSYYIP